MSEKEKPAQKAPICFGGSCVCQRMTYECRSIPTSCSECHCTTCRKLSGAAFQCFPDVDSKDIAFFDNTEHLRYEGLPQDSIGGITFLRFSKVSERAFCKDCFTPLAMRYKNQPDVVALTLGSVDESTIRDDEVREALMPKSRIFMEQNAWWCEGKAGLTEHERFGGSFEEEMKAWEEKEG